MRNLAFYFLFIPFFTFSQFTISGDIIDKSTNKPLPFAKIKSTDGNYVLSSIDGKFNLNINKLPVNIIISYIGYNSKEITISSANKNNISLQLQPKSQLLGTVNLKNSEKGANTIIRKAIAAREKNSPYKSLKSFSYKSYNKFKITAENTATLESQDTANIDIEQLFNKAHSFLSEKISKHEFQNGKGEKEIVLATQMTGFKKPVYDVLGIKVQSNTPYQEDYVIFKNRYAAPLSRTAFRNYYYKILDTTQTDSPAYVILFQPKRFKAIASLEGVLYLDVKTLAIQKAIMEVKGELDIRATHHFKYFEKEEKWFPCGNEITIKPGYGKQKITVFGGRISIGRLAESPKEFSGDNEFLVSKTDYFDIQFNPDINLKRQTPSMIIGTEASSRPYSYWDQYRTQAITKKDIQSFPVVDSIVKAQKIERKINIIQNFSIGYYPVSFFDFDLTYPIKFNNYEGLRLGIGGITNEKLSKRFRLEGYLVYGFIDDAFKYGIGGGTLLKKDSGTWLNLNYNDDIKEVGSFSYLTDRRVYSLFEPRLVNIDSYYKNRTIRGSVQHRFAPKLLSEAEFSVSKIAQTKNYRYIFNDEERFNYKIAEASFSLRWSPFSKYLKTPDGLKELYDGYPKISFQYSAGFKGLFKSDFNYSKIGLKIAYTINRINESSTNFLFEGNIASGDIPLTHLYHAFPNSPTKETIARRFSVAGRRSFETMYFSEFFSDRLTTLHIRHKVRPFKITSWLKPELVLISRYALGDIGSPERHLGFDFKSLQHGYQESGFEINKLFAGFGLSFAYRYGAYHLPKFEDNIAFKFTFYLKL